MCKAEIRKAVVIVLLSVLSCQADKDYDLPDDVVWTSPHFAYHSRTGDQSVCEDIAEKLEQHFSSIQTTIGFDWPAGRTIHYYKFPTRDDFVANSPCPAGSAACTESNHVYSYRVFEQHELVHAYLWPLGLPPPLITEGAAVALSCSQTISSTPSLSLQDALRVPDALSDQRVYDTGGRLVRFLLATYGAESFLRFYSHLGAGSTFDTLDHLMRATFGAGAEEIWQETLATPANCPPPFECSRDALPLDGTLTEIRPTCGLFRDARTFTLAATADIAITSSALLLVASCDAINFSAIRVTSANPGGQQVGLVTLKQGHYYLDIRSSEPTTVQIAAATFP
jgi:hypothetical protein